MPAPLARFPSEASVQSAMTSLVAAPLFGGPLPEPKEAKRPRGRPRGSKADVVKDARALGVHAFAFVRSSLLGLDLADAFERYMSWADSTTDLRHVQNRRDGLLKEIIEAGRQYDAGLAPSSKITHLLDLLRSDVPAKPAVVLPSLDEWIEAEGMDPDGWSEADLLSEYKAHFGLDNADAIDAAEGVRDPAGERVRALNFLETVLSVIPTANDRLEVWFARPVAKVLRNVGLVTLNDLVRYINAYGHGWHTLIKGFGKERARRVLTWLVLEQEHLNLAVSGNVHEPKSKRLLRTQDLLPAPAPVFASLYQFGAGTRVAGELLQMQRSPQLVGAQGDFRSHMANTLGAKNDLEAVNAWLARYDEKPNTQRSYRKEVERFLLWCAQVLKKPLSSVNAPDCQKYREFLQAVPASWIERLSVQRTDPLWRPFRAQPGAASQKQALIILQTLFSGLVDAGYLVANPMRALMKTFDLAPTKIDIRRSFTEAEWGHVLSCLQGMKAGPAQLRLRCVLELLVTSGIRLEELANARHKDLRLEVLPDLPETWILTVTGKRNKTREVPLQSEIVELLAAHRQGFDNGESQSSDPGDLPLIRTLHTPVPQWSRGQDGQLVAAPRTEKTGLALSASGIYAVLKSFFKRAAKSAGAAGLDPRRFQAASTHWMRHTFVRQALVDGMPIEVASELAGHASIDTTSIYSTQELSRKIKAVQRMKRRSLAGGAGQGANA